MTCALLYLQRCMRDRVTDTLAFVQTVIMGPISCISSTSSTVQGMAYWLFQEPQQIAAAKQG